MDAARASREDVAEYMRPLLEKLTSKGVRLRVWGCGCCGSPDLKVEIDGELIVDIDCADIDMFKEAK